MKGAKHHPRLSGSDRRGLVLGTFGSAVTRKKAQCVATQNPHGAGDQSTWTRQQGTGWDSDTAQALKMALRGLAHGFVANPRAQLSFATPCKSFRS